MCEAAEHDLAIDHRTIRVKGVPTDGLFEIRSGDDGDIYLICEKSSRVYALTVAEAETFANDMRRMVEQMCLAGSVSQSPDNAKSGDGRRSQFRAVPYLVRFGTGR
jgi:hypothetical protein